MTFLPDNIAEVLTQALVRKPVTPVTRAMVHDFQAQIEASSHAIAPDKFTVKHHFASGMYMRELHIPAGMITIGKIHKYPCLNILAKGKRATLVEGFMVTVEAPHISLSPAGMKRVSYTLEDAVWITAHATDKTDVDAIEHDLVCDSEEEYQAFLNGTERICHS